MTPLIGHTAVLLIITVLAGCTKPLSTPVTAAAPPSSTVNDNLEERVDALIADFRTREAADRERRTHPVQLRTGTMRKIKSRVRQEKANDREVAAATPTAAAGALVIKTSLDEMRDRAADAFAGRVADLQRKSAAVVRLRHEANAACSGTTSGTSLGAVIGPLEQRAQFPVNNSNISLTMGNIEIANATTPQCRAMKAGVEAEEAAMKAEFDSIETDARRAGIYPGVMRELFAKYEIRR